MRIFVTSVVREMPSCAAARVWLPAQSASARTIRSRSAAVGIPRPTGVACAPVARNAGGATPIVAGAREHDRALDHRLELAHVARPRV